MPEDFQPPDASSRRVWLKRFALGTVASLTLPRWTGTLLADVDESFPGSAVLRLKISDYPDLAAPGGSIQLEFKAFPAKPLTLNRISESEFVTLDSICTHQQCTVGPFVVADGYMECPCHGSQYDLLGRVTAGPASINLNRFTTTYVEEAGMVEIAIPGLALEVNSIQVFPQPASGSVRVHLRFPATEGSTYEIMYQSFPGGQTTIAPFTVTPDGTVFQTSITPAGSGFITAYLDATGTSGFYVVGLKLTQV